MKQQSTDSVSPAGADIKRIDKKKPLSDLIDFSGIAYAFFGMSFICGALSFANYVPVVPDVLFFLMLAAASAFTAHVLSGDDKVKGADE